MSAMTSIQFKHEGFGIHTATIDNVRYQIAPMAYDKQGNPKYGYTAVRVTRHDPSVKATFTTIARGSFAACRNACKSDAKTINHEVAA